MKKPQFRIIFILLLTLDVSKCCLKNFDPQADLRRREINLPNNNLIQLLKLFLEATTSTTDHVENSLGDPPPSTEMYPGNINDNWTPSIYQFWKGQDLHSLVSLRHAVSRLVGKMSVHEQLQDYSSIQLSEIKVWFESKSGDVAIYFPASIDLGMLDVYHVLSGGTEKRNGFAKYVQSAAKKNYDEFRKWFTHEQNFKIKSVKVLGHSRGAAIADFFLFIGRTDLFRMVENITLFRGSPLPSLEDPENNVFGNVNVVNIVLFGDQFRDPYTKINQHFFHPQGIDIFLRV